MTDGRRPRTRALLPLILGIVFLGPLVGPVRSGDAPPTVDDADVYPCGTLALYVIGRLEGRCLRLEEVDRLLGGPSYSDHSMAQLVDAAHAFGLELEGVRLGPKEFPVNRPVIAHLNRKNGGHYVVIRPLKGSTSKVQFIEPAEGATIVEYRRLAASPSWTGLGLVRRTARHDVPTEVMFGAAALAAGASGLALAINGVRHCFCRANKGS